MPKHVDEHLMAQFTDQDGAADKSTHDITCTQQEKGIENLQKYLDDNKQRDNFNI